MERKRERWVERGVICAAVICLPGCFSVPYAHLEASKDKHGTQRFGYVVSADFAEEYGGYDQAVEAALPLTLDAKGLCPDGWVLTGSSPVELARIYKGYCK